MPNKNFYRRERCCLLNERNRKKEKKEREERKKRKKNLPTTKSESFCWGISNFPGVLTINGDKRFGLILEFGWNGLGHNLGCSTIADNSFGSIGRIGSGITLGTDDRRWGTYGAESWDFASGGGVLDGVVVEPIISKNSAKAADSPIVLVSCLKEEIIWKMDGNPKK